MVTKCKSIAAWCYDIGTATLNSPAVSAWLFLYTPSYSRIRLGDRMAGVSYAPLSSAPLVLVVMQRTMRSCSSGSIVVSSSNNSSTMLTEP